MSTERTLARSFSGGEVTPEFFGRIDDAKYQTGLALCRNFVVLPHGPVQNRAGTRMVRETQDSDKRAAMRSFSFSADQTMALEFGDGYVRFHTMGATLLQGAVATYSAITNYTPGDMAEQGGVNYVNVTATTGVAPPSAEWYAMPASGEYEIPSPFAEADLLDLHFEQSLDVLTITHPNYHPQELRRGGATKWYFSQPDFVSKLVPPTGLAVAVVKPTTSGQDKDHEYVVTTVGEGADESLPTASVTATNNLNGVGNLNKLTWTAAAGAVRYNVYKLQGGIFGFLGQAEGLEFIDDNIAPDTSYCPPEDQNPFDGPGNYPAAVAYHEQRRCFAGTINKPSNFWGTRSGTESNLQYSIPTRDDDALQFRIAARQNQTIRHLVSMQDLIILTASAEWRVRTTDDVLTPTSFNVKPQSYIGASNVQPLLASTTILFGTSRGGHVREMGFSTEAGGWITGDLSLRAPHRFDNFEIVDAALAKSPYPIAWWVSSAGNLLSLTYVPEQKVAAWASHDTDGVFESVCVVAEGKEDFLYAIVRRTIGGVTKRFVERMASRAFTTPADAFFVDCGLTYEGPPVSVLEGLDHLEGKTVSILGDGAVRPPQVVVGGEVELDAPASKAHVGLPITADIQTLPVVLEMAAYAQGRAKNVNQVFLRVFQSLGINAGPALDQLTEYQTRTTETFGSPPDLKDGEVQVTVEGNWENDGAQVYVRQTDPLPLTIVNLTLELEVGG